MITPLDVYGSWDCLEPVGLSSDSMNLTAAANCWLRDPLLKEVRIFAVLFDALWKMRKLFPC